MKTIRIRHRSGLDVAEGPLGWRITPFEGNLYIRRKHLKTDGFRPNWLPGLCIYKFLYVWMDLHLPGGKRVKNVGWKYWLPNPLFPFIWLRVAIDRSDPEWIVEEHPSPVPPRVIL